MVREGMLLVDPTWSDVCVDYDLVLKSTMGQSLKRLRIRMESNPSYTGFPDLAEWPPELSLLVLSHLNATDLCLAACVWQGLAKDQVLWHGLCVSQWGHVTAYREHPKVSYHKLYLLLDEATITFNADAFLGFKYMAQYKLLDIHDPMEIAKFIYHTKTLQGDQLQRFLFARRDILDCLVSLYDFKGHFLSRALRKFFLDLHAPLNRTGNLHLLLEKFSSRYAQCNPHPLYSPDSVYILCFSLLLLSSDLTSPQIRNKMSKREFIRNLRNAVRWRDDELFGHLYDDVYLRGHVAPHT